MATKKTAKKSSKKKTVIKKGSKYVCSECGVVMVVDEVCGCLEVCDLICCGKQLKIKK
jgi:hypothetical protein